MAPAPGAWGAMLTSPTTPAQPSERREVRRSLGLDPERPVVMTGHQATRWHPGILAKYIAAAGLADLSDAQSAHVVVDHDGSAGFEAIDVPVREANGRVRVRRWRMAPGVAPRRSLATVPAFVPSPFEPDDAAPPVSDAAIAGITRYHTSLVRHVGADSAAAQIVGAIGDLASQWIGSPAAIVWTSRLARFDAFGALLDRMHQDPRACVNAYNRAVRAVRSPGLVELFTSDVNELHELPLWEITPAGERRRVFAHELAAIDRARLAPRAVLLTAFLRLDVCDLFIAGTGAGHDRGYERVVERWVGEWLGRPVAPAVVVSADLTLLDELGVGARADDTRARWLAHHARHDPESLADPVRAVQKQAILASIRDASRRGIDPAPSFRELHELLREMRSEHAAALDALDNAARGASVRAANDTMLADRTQPFFFFDDETISRMRDSIIARLDPSDRSCGL